jgi:multidrug efflux pump subunit AcrB
MHTPTDIFPAIRTPVIAVGWQYTGLPPDEMVGRISTLFQRTLTMTVNDIEHIEANTYPGISIMMFFFQPAVDVAVVNAQVTAVSQSILRRMPPGTTPPLILNYNAATVPIPQLALSGKNLSEQNLFDLGVCAAEGFLKSHSLYSVHAGYVWRGTDPKDDRKAANQVEMCASQCRI